jgi:hypothetical protein
MPTLQERFALVFPPPQQRGLLAEIARTCEVSSPTVTAWFRTPEKVASIERSNAEKICAKFAPAISPAWLAEGTGPMHAADLGAREPPIPARDFDDRVEVSPSDWGVLQDVHLVMSDDQLRSLRKQAERIRRIAREQIAAVAVQKAKSGTGK